MYKRISLSRAALAGALALAVAMSASLQERALAHEPLRTRGGAFPAAKAATRADARSVNHVIGARLADAASSLDLTDGDDATATGDAPLAVRYAGAAEWTNEIEIRYRGEGSVVVDLLHPHDRWTRDVVRADLPASAEWTTTVVAVAPARYQGITVTPASVPGRAPIEISELGSYWFEGELLRDDYEVADEWAEDYPGTSNDLTSPNETAQRFSDYLRDHGWTWKFDYGNQNCWEEDFKRHDLGGTNNNFVDATDAFIYCGHGSTNTLSLADDDHDDSTVSSGDINNAWGDTDLEWAFFHCCLNLSSTSWASGLAGTHTISGAINVINGSSNYGKTIAKKLIDNGIFDSAWSIYSSWWHANDSHQPAGNQFRLLAEDQGHYNENIWGEGSVLSDSDDSQHWTVSHTVSKAYPGDDIFDPAAVQPTSEPIDWPAPAALGDPGDRPIKVRVHPEVLTKRVPDTAWILEVMPSGMDDGTTGQMFERLCEVLDLDCADLAVGREDGEGYAAASGLANLSGDIISGGWQFTNLERHLVPERGEDVQVGPAEAAQRAQALLQQLELLNDNSFLGTVNTLEAAEFDSTGEILQSFPIAYDVVIGTRRAPQGEALPVVGPGGRSHVCVGVDGSIQAFNHVLRNAQPRTPVDVISIQTALDQLAAFGYQNLQAPPEFLAEAVEIRDANLGYFEQGLATPQPRVGPVYYFDVDLIGPDPEREGQQISVPGRIFLAADTLPLRGEILAPEDGDTFEYGQNIAFRSSAMNGTPPYQFRWISDVHGLISTDQNFSTDQLNPAFREDGTPSPITIELRVTDALGYTSTDQIAIHITGLIGVEDLPQVFELTGNHPNPFNPRTTISFATPVAGRAKLSIVDVRGRIVRELVDETVTAGRHARVWDGSDATGRPVAAGVYMYRLDFHGEDGSLHGDTQRMTLVR